MSLSDEADKIVAFRDTFKCTGRGMSIGNLKDFLKELDGTSDELKVLSILV